MNVFKVRNIYEFQINSALKNLCFLEKMVRDLKNLKLDLYSDLPRVKKVKPPPAETDEIERRLLDEVINDVIEGPFDLTNDDEDSDTNINIEEEMIRRGLLKPSGFGPMIERENLSRESESILEQLMRITIPERVQSIQINDIGEGFGEADHEEIAAAGVFDMSNGRQIYDSLNNRQTGAEIAQLVEQRRAAQVTDEVQGLSAQEALEPAEPAVSEIEIDLPATSHVEPVETEIPELPVRLESISLDDTPVRVSLRENIERILIENEIQKVKKRRKPRRKRRSPTVHRVDHGEILELNGPLKHHKRRRKKRVGRKPKAQLPLALDIFEGLSDYEPDRTYDEEDEMEIEVQSVPGVHLKVSQIEEMRRTQPSVQMTVTEPEIQAHKRMRIDEEASGSLLPPMSSLRVPSVSAQELSSDFAARVTPIAGPPRTKFQPEITSTAFKLPIQRLTIQDIEFAQLRQISKEPIQREEQQDVDTIISQMDRKKLMEEQTAAASEVSDTAPSPTTTSPLVKRFEKEGEKIIELRKDNGGYETYAEYDIEVRTLRNSV